jgi:DNA-binding MarR family transcriptional regulator
MSKQHYDAATYRAQNSVGYLIKRAHSMMLGVLEELFAQHQFTYIHYVILTWVRDGIAVNPRDICVRFRHDSGALTRVIDQLAERGLIERVRRDRDRRKVELQLTEAGRTTVEGLIPLVVDKLNLALADFSSEEVAELLRLLVKLNTRLESTVEPRAGVGPKAYADLSTAAHPKSAAHPKAAATGKSADGEAA